MSKLNESISTSIANFVKNGLQKTSPNVVFEGAEDNQHTINQVKYLNEARNRVAATVWVMATVRKGGELVDGQEDRCTVHGMTVVGADWLFQSLSQAPACVSLISPRQQVVMPPLAWRQVSQVDDDLESSGDVGKCGQGVEGDGRVTEDELGVGYPAFWLVCFLVIQERRWIHGAAHGWRNMRRVLRGNGLLVPSVMFFGVDQTALRWIARLLGWWCLKAARLIMPRTRSAGNKFAALEEC
ncbi:hypothetical protein ACJZ2D_012449 [Fusarium nematophilum]